MKFFLLFLASLALATGAPVPYSANYNEDPMSDEFKLYQSNHARSKRFALAGQKWDHTNVTYYIQNYDFDRNRSKLTNATIRSTIQKALAMWSKASEFVLTFRELNSTEADIVFGFYAGKHLSCPAFDGPGGIFAHSYYPGPDRDGDVHFDATEDWSVSQKAGTNLFYVVLHETGHALGLAHSQDPQAIMYDTIRRGVEVKLSKDDISAIRAVYGSKEKTKVPMTTDSTTEVPATTTDSNTEVPMTTDSNTEVPMTTDSNTEVPMTTTDSNTEVPISTDSNTEVPISTDSSTEIDLTEGTTQAVV